MVKFMIWVFIAGISILFSGCATIRRTTYGTGYGTTYGVYGAAYGFGTGAAKDVQDTTNAIIRADQWFRENWW